MQFDQPLLSIIVPVYNVENYLRRCLDSLVNQTLKDIEIIVVNDCSTDGSQEIIDEYMNRDQRIKQIIHTVNRGHGGALNTGLAQAKGAYIWVVDSDDILELNACNVLYNYCEYHHLDAVTFESVNFFEDKNGQMILSDCLYQTNRDLDGKTFTGEQYLELAFQNKVLTAPFWAYLFKKEILENFQARENVYYEDTDGSIMLLMSVKKIKSIRYTGYFRLIREDSSIGEQAKKITQKVIVSRLKVIDALFSYIQKNHLSVNHPVARITFQHYLWMSEVYKIFIQNNQDAEIELEFQKLKIFYQHFYNNIFNLPGRPFFMQDKIKMLTSRFPMLKNMLKKIYQQIIPK